MISMSQTYSIRQLRKSGESISEIARKVGVSRNTVYAKLAAPDLSPQMPVKEPREKLLDAYRPVIEGYLDEDERGWRKQRHTARRIWQRLRDEHGVACSESTVRHYVHVTCIVFSDTLARGFDALEFMPTTTERTVCHAKSSRQVHRRVQARDRRLYHLDGQADNAMLLRARPQLENRRQMGPGPPPRARRRARSEGRGPRAARGEKAHTRARDGERLPEKKAAAFFAKSQAWPRATG